MRTGLGVAYQTETLRGPTHLAGGPTCTILLGPINHFGRPVLCRSPTHGQTDVAPAD